MVGKIFDEFHEDQKLYDTPASAARSWLSSDTLTYIYSTRPGISHGDIRKAKDILRWIAGFDH